jgi:hypothetical protein
MTSRNDDVNAIRLLKALIARGANRHEPMANAWITEVALEIGLEGAELDSALTYAGTQNWIENTTTMKGRTFLTTAGEVAAL